MIETFTYKNHTNHSEGTFTALFNGISYRGHYECEIDTEVEWSSEFGCMGVTNQNIEKESIHLINDEPLGTEEELYVSPDKHPALYNWIHDRVNVLEAEKWKLQPIAGTSLIDGTHRY